MPAVKVHWTRLSKPQFDDLRKRAEESERLAEFSRAHNEIVLALRDLDQAMTKGEPAYRTRKSGGVRTSRSNDLSCGIQCKMRQKSPERTAIDCSMS